MLVQRINGDQLLFSESDTGIKAIVFDVVIPSDLNENEIATYLDDICHECSNEKHSIVTKIN